ncbi:MAG: hypothetical protein RSE56_04080, partial [Bacilli bacterium]
MIRLVVSIKVNNEKREEFDKIFSINNLPEKINMDEETIKNFKKNLKEMLPHYDGVIVCDFGHGLIDE